MIIKTFALFVFALALLAGAETAATAQTSAFSYQGRMQAGGTNYNGNGWFKFAVIQLGTNQARSATAVASVSSGNVKTIDVTDGGAGYLTPPVVTIYGTPGPAWGGATATANVSHGMVVSIDVQTVGTNYFLGAFVSIAAPPPNFTVLTDWSNNGSSVDGSEPSLPVPIPVANGLFNINLGASPATVYLDPLIFTNDDLLLRIWFSADGTNYQQLTPDQPLTATPYAMMAANAANAFYAVNVLGTIPAGGLTGTYGSPVAFSNAANIFSGSGSNLTGLNASQLISGTVPDARLAGNVARLNGSASFAGGVAATNFTGSGAGLNGLNGAAINAGSITNGALANATLTAGKIAGGQVVKSFNGLTDAVVLSAGNNVSLTTVGNTVTVIAAPSTGVPWLKVTATNVLAQPNTGYVVTNSGTVTIALPVSPNFGDVVRLSNIGTGHWQIFQTTNQTVITANLTGRTNGEVAYQHEVNRDWTGVASSTNGNKLVGIVNAGAIFTSVDFGTNWTPHGITNNWSAVASSADGSKLAATVYGGQIYTSSDSGANWTPHASVQSWDAIASSTNGTKLVATASGGQIYVSTDSGVTWTPHGVTTNWNSVASSADGNKLVATCGFSASGRIYTSTDSGVTWTPRGIDAPWVSVASSADGIKLVAGNFFSGVGGDTYTSSDSGVTWTLRANQYSVCLASSANGAKLVAVVGYGIYTSADSGVTWIPRTGPTSTKAVATSSDGSKLIAVESLNMINSQPKNGLPYTSTDSGVTWTPQYGAGIYSDGVIYGSQNSALELQYIGNNQFLPLGIIGNINSY